MVLYKCFIITIIIIIIIIIGRPPAMRAQDVLLHLD